LAVIPATSDHATQPIIKKARHYDPQGERTLGIITKPDRLEGAGMKKQFLDLAQNKDPFFKLGWHVLKNRSYEERGCTLAERKESEKRYFEESIFHQLPADTVGIDALRRRLSLLLFDHIKHELPQLRRDLEAALENTEADLSVLGKPRSFAAECKDYLAQLSLDYYEVCKAAVDGHYEGEYFHNRVDRTFDPDSSNTIARLRAVVQHKNTEFYNRVRNNGGKYRFDFGPQATRAGSADRPVMDKTKALQWVREGLMRTRGKELIGNYNPLLVGELFWEQSSPWEMLARDYIEEMAHICEKFLDSLLEAKCPADVKTRVWASAFLDTLKERRSAAARELGLIMEDVKSFPMNYDKVYVDDIRKRRSERQSAALVAIETAANIKDYFERVVGQWNADMELFSCEEALDCVFAIYEVLPLSLVCF
jgi:hypothetical protein